MSPAAKSLFVFGIYAVAAGAGLLLTPGLVLGTLGFPAAQDGWVRVVGGLAVVVGAYHIVGARNDLLPYIRASVWGRIGFAVLLGSLVLASVMPRSLLLFAAIDLAAAVWTAIALRARSARPPPRQSPGPGGSMRSAFVTAVLIVHASAPVLGQSIEGVWKPVVVTIDSARGDTLWIVGGPGAVSRQQATLIRIERL